MNRNGWRKLASAGVALCTITGATFASSSGAVAETAAAPLDIMLTNDDGVHGGFIDIIRDELCGAGHRVTVVAPSGDQSGNSSRFTSARDAKLKVTTTSFTCGDGTGQQHSIASTWTAKLGAGGTYSYNGPASPVDAVRFALDVVYRDAPPDLVVTGANPGQNLSSVVLKSGTVGAALAAAAKHVPAIALSVAYNPADSPQLGFPAAPFAARALGDWTVSLLGELQRQQQPGDGLLPDGLSLNVNHPTPLRSNGQYAPEKVGPAVLTVAGDRDLIPISYVETGTPGEYRVAVSLCGFPGSPAKQCQAPEVRDADTTAIDRNQISVQPMDGDVTVTPPASSGLHKALNRLNR